MQPIDPKTKRFIRREDAKVQDQVPAEKVKVEKGRAESPFDAATQARRGALVAELSIAFNAMSPGVGAVFQQLQSTTAFWMAEQGFWKCDNFGEKISLIHSEISEALKAHRKALPSEHIQSFSGVEEELADAMIRIFDLAGKMQLNLAGAMMAKYQYNLTRPVMHGKAY